MVTGAGFSYLALFVAFLLAVRGLCFRYRYSCLHIVSIPGEPHRPYGGAPWRPPECSGTSRGQRLPGGVASTVVRYQFDGVACAVPFA